MSKIETAVSFMEAIARDNSHGYDQAHRNGPNYDCSSLVGTALHKAGFNVNSGSTTRNLREQLLKNGFNSSNLDEKVHIAIHLIDDLCHEIVYHKHKDLNYDVMIDLVIENILNLM